MDKTCASCKKIIKTKYDTCEHCLRIYHPSCTTLKSVRNSQNNTIKACRSCIAEANANNKMRDSINGNNSTEHPTDTNSSSEWPSAFHTGVQTTPSDPLQQILQKLSTLESLDKRITEIQTSFDTRLKDMQSSLVTRFEEVKTTLNTRLDEVSTRMTNLEGRLTPLDDLPLLSNRLSAAKEAITQIQSEPPSRVWRTLLSQFCSCTWYLQCQAYWKTWARLPDSQCCSTKPVQGTNDLWALDLWYHLPERCCVRRPKAPCWWPRWARYPKCTEDASENGLGAADLCPIRYTCWRIAEWI